MPTPVNRFLRAGRRSATRQATPLCAVAAVASMAAGLPTGITLALGGLIGTLLTIPNTAPDADGFIFAMVSSAMFMSWQKAVGGRLKSDIRFSNTLVWNNFPLPAVDQALRTRIAAAGEAVLAARDQHPERTLAKHYNASHMDPDLYKAHAELDALVDKAFGARGRQSDAGRQTLLFNSYADLVGADQLVPQENSRPARRRS